MSSYRAKFNIEAESETNAQKKIAVIDNMLNNISENAFVNILYEKIKANPQFFKKLADNPILKMF